jgi:hypothetical protein
MHRRKRIARFRFISWDANFISYRYWFFFIWNFCELCVLLVNRCFIQGKWKKRVWSTVASFLGFRKEYLKPIHRAAQHLLLLFGSCTSHKEQRNKGSERYTPVGKIRPTPSVPYKSAILAFEKNFTKNAILDNRSNHLPNLVIRFDLRGKTYCIWLTNEGIRVFSFLHKIALFYGTEGVLNMGHTVYRVQFDLLSSTQEWNPCSFAPSLFITVASLKKPQVEKIYKHLKAIHCHTEFLPCLLCLQLKTDKEQWNKK